MAQETTQAEIAKGLERSVDWVLEFRTWTGSAFEWTDYTSHLIRFSRIGSQVEQSAFPNAFRLSMGSITVDNSDNFWSDPTTLDGVLVDSAQPYGKGFYKRMVRVSAIEVDGQGNQRTTILFVGLVRDIVTMAGGVEAIINVISLDARANDQRCDGETAERHPLGGTVKTSPSDWTIVDPGLGTGEVALYRWREQETEDDQFSFGWFRNQHIADIIERTKWALDDLGSDIVVDRLMTAVEPSFPNGREIVTSINIPPDDGSISDGVTPDRTRTLVWNSDRNCLLVAVGHRLYDYDPVLHTYTLRNTLTAGRDVVRAWYTTEADSGGEDERIVLLQMDINGYPGSHVLTAYTTTLDATGSGAYTLLDNETSLGSDVFPGTHQVRVGGYTPSPPTDLMGVGQKNTEQGENYWLAFRQQVDIIESNPANAHVHNEFLAKVGLFTDTNASFQNDPMTADRGFGALSYAVAPGGVDTEFQWSYLHRVVAGLQDHDTGGRLVFCTWDSTNKYRLKEYNLSTYAAGSYITLPTSSEVPTDLWTHPTASLFYLTTMEWKDAAGTSDYSVSHIRIRDMSADTWSEKTFLSGASGDEQAWMVMEIVYNPVLVGLAAILFNRETLKWRFCKDVLEDAWADTNANCKAFPTTVGGTLDQESRLEGLFYRASTGTNFVVMSGSNTLWEHSGTHLLPLNQTPGDATGAVVGDPINSDRGLGSNLASTGASYPDQDTPGGMMFGVSANDHIDAGANHPAGEYVLWQFTNWHSGFVPLLDVSGLSLWGLRSLLAEAFGHVHYYDNNGDLIFKVREQTAAVSFTFSDANKNKTDLEITTRGYEAVINDVVTKPYRIGFEERLSDIIKSGETESTGLLTDVIVSPDPGEASQWRVVFVTGTTYDLFKMQGDNADTATPKVSGQSVNEMLRDIPDGTYLAIAPSNFSGQFAADDSFLFWVLEPTETLEQTSGADWTRVLDQDSIDTYQRNRTSGTFDNRFVSKQLGLDHATAILDWRKDPHDVVRLTAPFDPAYRPLLTAKIVDADLGYDTGDTFQIMGVIHESRLISTLTLVKL